MTTTADDLEVSVHRQQSATGAVRWDVHLRNDTTGYTMTLAVYHDEAAAMDYAAEARETMGLS